MTGWAKVAQQFPSGPSTRGTCPGRSSGFSSSKCGKHRRVKIVNVFFQLCNSLCLTLFFSVSRLSLVVISLHSNRKTETRTNVRSARYFISHLYLAHTLPGGGSLAAAYGAPLTAGKSMNINKFILTKWHSLA